jgi:hypothetical protein
MFGDLKHPEEDGYNPEVDLPLTDGLNEENMKAVV